MCKVKYGAERIISVYFSFTVEFSLTVDASVDLFCIFHLTCFVELEGGDVHML